MSGRALEAEDSAAFADGWIEVIGGWRGGGAVVGGVETGAMGAGGNGGAEG